MGGDLTGAGPAGAGPAESSCRARAAALLARVGELGIKVEARDGRLRLTDPHDALTDPLRDQMRELKAELLALVAERAARGDTLRRLARSREAFRVWSSVLDETVVFAADNVDTTSRHFEEWLLGHGLPADVPVYRASELAALVRCGGRWCPPTPDHLRFLHEVKMTFRPSVIAPEERK